MIECGTRREMEKKRYLYEVLLKMACTVDIMYANYEEKMAREEREKERARDDGPSPSSSDYSSSSSSSHHADEEIN